MANRKGFFVWLGYEWVVNDYFLPVDTTKNG